jgi:uncharacterized protein (TIGR00730 family)
MKSVGVFCGGNPGVRASYSLAASRLGEVLAARGLTLVYGGARVGLMGTLAGAAIAAGARVEGVLPEFLASKERAYDGLAELEIVGSMHERKASMAKRSDAFIALPGGYGTLDELFEMLTWAQIGLIAKPCGLLDVDSFFASLVAYLDHATAEGLIRPEHRAMLLVDADPERLVDRLAAAPPPTGSILSLART